MKDEFEKWARERGLNTERSRRQVGYRAWATQDAYLAWQASRKQALEEAEAACDVPDPMEFTDFWSGVAACTDAIRALQQQ